MQKSQRIQELSHIRIISAGRDCHWCGVRVRNCFVVPMKPFSARVNESTNKQGLLPGRIIVLQGLKAAFLSHAWQYTQKNPNPESGATQPRKQG